MLEPAVGDALEIALPLAAKPPILLLFATAAVRFVGQKLRLLLVFNPVLDNHTTEPMCSRYACTSPHLH